MLLALLWFYQNLKVFIFKPLAADGYYIRSFGLFSSHAHYAHYIFKRHRWEEMTHSRPTVLLAGIWLPNKENTKWRKKCVCNQPGFTIQWIRGRSTVFQLCLCGKHEKNRNTMCVPLFLYVRTARTMKHCYIVCAYCAEYIEDARPKKKKREVYTYETSNISAYMLEWQQMAKKKKKKPYTFVIHYKYMCVHCSCVVYVYINWQCVTIFRCF